MDLASKALVGIATAYKALKGKKVSDLQAWAMGSVLGMTMDEFHGLVARSGKGAA